MSKQKRTEPYRSRKQRVRDALSDEFKQQADNQERYGPMEARQRIENAKEACRRRRESRSTIEKREAGDRTPKPVMVAHAVKTLNDKTP